MNKQEFLTFLKSKVDAAGSQKNLAEDLGLSQQYINDVVWERRAPSAKLLQRLGMEKIVTYQMAVPAARQAPEKL